MLKFYEVSKVDGVEELTLLQVLQRLNEAGGYMQAATGCKNSTRNSLQWETLALLVEQRKAIKIKKDAYLAYMPSECTDWFQLLETENPDIYKVCKVNSIDFEEAIESNYMDFLEYAEFDSILNDCNNQIEVGGCIYDYSDVFKELDPIGYEIEYTDWKEEQIESLKEECITEGDSLGVIKWPTGELYFKII